MLSQCCHEDDNHDHSQVKTDYLLWSTATLIVLGYLTHLFFADASQSIPWLHHYAHATFEISNKMWWGILLGIVFVGLLEKVPRDYIMAILGSGLGLQGILRATAAGLLLDMCNHGILLIGMKLYQRGASLGQVMAFLIASPWNSLSLTIVLVALIGLKWTLGFIFLSAVIAIVSGVIFNSLVKKGVLPANPNQKDISKDFNFFNDAKLGIRNTRFDFEFFRSGLVAGLKDSLMIIRWLFLGVVIAALLRAFFPTELFQQYFGPTLVGLFLTLLATTIIEVCSEGSAPIAADILNRAAAPGNSFTFLMAGVSTDYTEILAIKETTKSLKVSLFLPLVTVPQILLLGYLLNTL